jgi:Fis family transcriptional regulator, factor for inversion stimulation protein
MNKTTTLGPSLGDFSRQMVQRYLSQIQGHPAAQLHRLIMNEVEKPLLIEVLRHCQGNLTHASELLGMNRATLRKKLDEHGIDHKP